MDTRFAISEYHDAAAINRQLDELIKQPIHTIKPDVLKKYEEEYYDKKCLLGFDIDAGPIIFNLSPTGTAFGIGPATYFEDWEARKGMLKTAELAKSLGFETLKAPEAINTAITVANEISYFKYPIHDSSNEKIVNVRAAAGGEVIYTGIHKDIGACVRIKHGDKISTYGNLHTINVKVGEYVLLNTVIGTSGGGESYDYCTTGPHLHFGVKVGSSYVNPRNYINFPSRYTLYTSLGFLSSALTI